MSRGVPAGVTSANQVATSSSCFRPPSVSTDRPASKRSSAFRVRLSRSAPGPRRWGIRRHVQMAPWTDSVEVHWGTGAQACEAYVTPVADDCVGIAILSATRGGFDSHFEIGRAHV